MMQILADTDPQYWIKDGLEEEFAVVISHLVFNLI
jgi:hypothetical protein